LRRKTQISPHFQFQHYAVTPASGAQAKSQAPVQLQNFSIQAIKIISLLKRRDGKVEPNITPTSAQCSLSFKLFMWGKKSPNGSPQVT